MAFDTHDCNVSDGFKKKGEARQSKMCGEERMRCSYAHLKKTQKQMVFLRRPNASYNMRLIRLVFSSIYKMVVFQSPEKGLLGDDNLITFHCTRTHLQLTSLLFFFFDVQVLIPPHGTSFLRISLAPVFVNLEDFGLVNLILTCKCLCFSTLHVWVFSHLWIIHDDAKNIWENK